MVLIPSTNATLAVTHIRVTNYHGNTVPTNVILRTYGTDDSGGCTTVYLREVARYEVDVRGQASDDFSTPVLVRPGSFGTYCLGVEAYSPTDGPSSWGIRVAVDGWVVSGNTPQTSTYGPESPAPSVPDLVPGTGTPRRPE